MPKALYRLLFLLTAIFLHGSLAAQPQPGPAGSVGGGFQHFTSEQGLSENVIYSLLQDSRGYLWVGTWDGLNRYDGYGFKKFYHNPFDSLSVSGNTINCIYEDPDGTLWIGTNTGLCRYNYERGDFTRVAHDRNLVQRNVRHIISTGDRALLVETGDAVFLVHAATLQSEEILLETEKGKQHFSVYSPFAVNGNGQVYVCRPTGFGIYIYVQQEKIFRYSPLTHISLPGEYNKASAQFVLTDKKGNVWICTDKERIFVFHSDGKTHKVSDDPLLQEKYSVQCMYVDAVGNVWIGTEQGLLQYDAGTDQLQLYRAGYLPQTLSSPSVNCIQEDRTGVIWVGTLNGLNKLMPSQKKIKHLAAASGGLLSNFILGLYDENGEQIRVNYNYGVRQFSKFRITDQSVRHFNKLDYPARPYVQEVLIRNSGKLSAGAIQSFTDQFLQEQRNRLLPPILMAGSNESIWYAQFQLFGVFTPGADGKYIDDTISIFKGEIFDACLDGEEIWLATANEGLVRYDIKEKAFKKFVTGSSTPGSISSDEVLCLLVKKEGIWVGTKGGGLNYFDRRPGGFVHYTTEQGLCNNSIYCMVEDDDGNLWLGTSNGLSRFDPAKKSCRNYFRNDGLANSEFNRYSALKTRNGVLYFGGMNGIDYFHPKDIMGSYGPPQLQVTDIKIYNKSIDRSGPLSFSWKNNYISFEFAAMDFRNPAANKFAYKLEGVDKDWVYVENRNFAGYPTLQPGKYRFMIKASNSDGTWNENPVTVEFNIRTPWWSTWWFYALCVIMLVAILYALYNFRIRQLKKMMLLRTKISRDLHDEVGATLTSISFLSEVAKNQSDNSEKPVVITLDKIGEYSRNMVAEMNDIVWAINPSNDKFDKIVDRIQDFASPLLASRNMQFRFSADEQLKNVSLGMQQRKNLYLFFKEAVNNAAKYSGGRQVTAILEKSDHCIRVQIVDDGKGFEASGSFQGNGLRNMRSRANEMGGELNISSSASKGTSIILEIPITKNAY